MCGTHTQIRRISSANPDLALRGLKGAQPPEPSSALHTNRPGWKQNFSPPTTPLKKKKEKEGVTKCEISQGWHKPRPIRDRYGEETLLASK